MSDNFEFIMLKCWLLGLGWGFFVLFGDVILVEIIWFDGVCEILIVDIILYFGQLCCYFDDDVFVEFVVFIGICGVF